MLSVPSVSRNSAKSSQFNTGSYSGLSSITGFKIFNDNNTPGNSCGMSDSSVDQPPRILDSHGPFGLFKKHPHNEVILALTQWFSTFFIPGPTCKHQ
uniref:Uncharacterized protein n=1 Tax=Crocodylus porosus TaxID=8502 RepID=A0A7M4EWC4_CROPO